MNVLIFSILKVSPMIDKSFIINLCSCSINLNLKTLMWVVPAWLNRNERRKYENRFIGAPFRILNGHAEVVGFGEFLGGNIVKNKNCVIIFIFPKERDNIIIRCPDEIMKWKIVTVDICFSCLINI